MSEVEKLRDQFKRAFVGPAWHGPSVTELLEGVTAEKAAARPVAGAHSTWEVVLHIAAWKDAVRRSLGGEAVELTGEQDWPVVRDSSEQAWISTLEWLKRAHNQLERTLDGLNDSALERPVPGKDYNVYFLLHGVIQHDLYHAGQIAVLKKAA